MTIMSTIYSRLSYGTGTTLTGCGVSAKAYVETAKTAKEVSLMLALPENVVSVAPEGDMLNWTGHNGFMMQLIWTWRRKTNRKHLLHGKSIV